MISDIILDIKDGGRKSATPDEFKQLCGYVACGFGSEALARALLGGSNERIAEELCNYWLAMYDGVLPQDKAKRHRNHKNTKQMCEFIRSVNWCA